MLGLFGYRHYPFWKFGSLSKLFARIGGRSAGSPIPSAQIGTSCSLQARACALRGSSVNVTNISMVMATPWVVSTNGSSQALTGSQPVLAARSYMSFLWIIGELSLVYLIKWGSFAPSYSCLSVGEKKIDVAKSQSTEIWLCLSRCYIHKILHWSPCKISFFISYMFLCHLTEI
jgi:hypothetical protein